MKRIRYIIFLILLLFPLVSKAASIEEQRKALRETALAFYRKDAYVQYDSYRRDATATPEDASVDHSIYTDCGVFLYQIYNQALGIKIPSGSYALAAYANHNYESVVVNLVANNDDNSNVIGELTKWTNNSQSFSWQTGDIIVIRRYDGSGHVMFVDADNPSYISLIESAYVTGGGFYDANNYVDKVEKRGIFETGLQARIKEYIKYGNSADGIKQVSVLRFVNNGSTYVNEAGQKTSYNITEAGLARIKYPSITISKLARVTNTAVDLSNDFAVPGSSIMYQIFITNDSNTDYTNITIEEEKDSKVSFKMTSNGSINGNKITWVIPKLKAHSSYTIVYMVNIDNSDNALGQVIVSKGKVVGLNTPVLRHYVLNGLSSDLIDKLKSNYLSLKGDKEKDIDFIIKLYKNSFNYDLSYLKNINVRDVLSVEHCKSTGFCQANIINNNIANITLLNYYGLKVIPYNYKNTEGLNILNEKLINANNAWDMEIEDTYNRAREIQVNDLQAGDIVLVQNNETKAYLYLGNKELVRNNGINIEILNNNDTLNFLRNIIGQNYLILRPAIMMNKTYEMKQKNEVVTSSKPAKKEEIVNYSKPVNSENDGLENPDCGTDIPPLVIIILILMLFIIKIIIKPNKLYKIS